MIKIYTLKSFLLLSIFMLVFSCHGIEEIDTETENKQESEAPSEISQMETDVLKYVNEHREANGKGKLEMNSFMSKEARNHSKNMATGIVPFSHDGFNDRANAIWENVGKGAVAENVAFNSFGAEKVFEQWKNSSGHNENMLGDFTLTGIGIYKVGDRYYFTQLFLKK